MNALITGQRQILYQHKKQAYKKPAFYKHLQASLDARYAVAFVFAFYR